MVMDIPLILFAKAPVAGKVKTRLTPDLSYEQASEVAKHLLEESLKLATKAWPGKVVLAVWPDAKNSFIQTQLSVFQVDHLVQVQGSLGVKMLSAMQQCGFPCAVMGCDVPHCEPVVLQKAYDALCRGENTLGPTRDGGYYLLGLQQAELALFENKNWGESSVLNDSVANAEQEKIKFTFLEQLSDIDHYDDLLNASQEMSSLKQFL